MSNSTPTPLAPLADAAAAVVALGECQAEIDQLDDASLQAGMRLVRDLEQAAQPYKLWLATAIARRSDHTLGYDGLARKNGFPTPAGLIQSLTGTSQDEATKLARLGAMMVEAETALEDAPDGTGGSGATAIATAATSGGISVDAADAIRRGLGNPDTAVTSEQLRDAAEKLIAHTQSASILGSVTPEVLLKLARQARGQLDLDAIERGEKERAEQRYVRLWQRDGLSGGSWCLPDEDGGSEINTALKLLLAKKRGGPRFPDTDANGDPIKKSSAEEALEDPRSADHIVADGFAQIFHNGLTADPTVVPGAGRAAVRVIVTEPVLTRSAPAAPADPDKADKAADPDKADIATPSDPFSTLAGRSALLEASMSPISFSKLEEYLCEGGTIEVAFNEDGTMDVGREQRLFTSRQRTALGVRDGGCRFPGCDKPPSWCEAHHILQWARDRGKTDVINGILLCRYHHMLVHNGGWDIIRRDGPGGGTYWLRPPTDLDPDQRLIEMPSKNPLVTAIRLAQTTIDTQN